MPVGGGVLQEQNRRPKGDINPPIIILVACHPLVPYNMPGVLKNIAGRPPKGLSAIQCCRPATKGLRGILGKLRVVIHNTLLKFPNLCPKIWNLDF